jgi:para-aminobenzoate N-oxygenase AurF
MGSLSHVLNLVIPMEQFPRQIFYKSSFGDWYSRASVRSKPRRVLSEELTSGLLCFSPELAPVSKHHLLIDRGELVVKEVLTRHLFAYLTFTDRLEHEVVNRTARRIAVGKLGMSLPQDMNLDALKIYCDEAYHSLFSVDLRQQISAALGIQRSSNSDHEALRCLRQQRDASAPEVRKLVELFFVIIAETLISPVLAKVPSDVRIVTAVRQMVADHAEDEGRHHVFFARLCEIVWPQMTEGQKNMIGPLLPRFILAFLGPDHAAIKAYLKGYFTAEEIAGIIAESYPQCNLVADARKAANKTLRIFRRCGVLENQRAADEFCRSELLGH